MDYKKFYEHFYGDNNKTSFSAQMDKQNKTIFHLKMELGKLKKQVQELLNKKEN